MEDPPSFRTQSDSSPPHDKQPRFFNATTIGQPCSDVVDARPSSVVDKRVDVTGSRDCLQSDDRLYLYSDVDSDETESELNDSANSRTLIWPNKDPREQGSAVGVQEKPPKFVWQEGDTPCGTVDARNSHVAQHQNDNNLKDLREPSHPHTPSPPPDEDVTSDFCVNRRNGSSSIHDHLVEKTRLHKSKLPALKGDCVPLAFSKRVNALTRRKKLIREEGDEWGLCNNGYESATSCSSKNSNYSVVIRDKKHKPRFFLPNPHPKQSLLDDPATTNNLSKLKPHASDHTGTKSRVVKSDHALSRSTRPEPKSPPLPDVVPRY